MPDWTSSQPLLSPSINNPSIQSNKKISLPRPPPVPKWKSENKPTKPSTHAPIDLSLGDDEGVVRGLRRGLSTESPEVTAAGRKIGSPVENGDADLLYEYFPLSVGDWFVSHSFFYSFFN